MEARRRRGAAETKAVTSAGFGRIRRSGSREVGGEAVPVCVGCVWVCCVSECCNKARPSSSSLSPAEKQARHCGFYFSSPALQKHHQTDPTTTPNSQAYSTQHQQHRADASATRQSLSPRHSLAILGELGTHLLPPGNSPLFAFVFPTHLHATHNPHMSTSG